ncbi:MULTISPECIES: hypothetical protein [Serratia]|jgi:hypothetical protein|uniref:Uncharacterized protein n=2 Tax=Serratia TaxID=613 RepID=A0A3E2EME1_SERMA|nr:MULTISPECIES: hypothetical protein [Serratia]MBM1295827.1 hypothetical protein [Serratia nematodiphila]ASM16082.1 hypothetical protein BVG90_04870 [Serratia marcescens]AWO78600.1 hypothetical protein C1N78_08270 [Serratia marcescens]EGT0453105.1 hypothetical protein [Serratia marcescens]EKX2166009.1 hypothetical protein [Serratia marcescens]
MADCKCNEQDPHAQNEHVADFTAVGFSQKTPAPVPVDLKQQGVLALKLSVCVGASYNPANNQICFTIPIYGDFCVSSPIPIPIGGQLKVCAETCGSFIPTGLKATIYLNGSVLFSVVLFGAC